MKNILKDYDFLKKLAIVILFSSMGIRFLTGAFLVGEIRAALIFATSVGFSLTLVLLGLCVVIKVNQTPPAERDEDGRINIREEKDKE